MLERVLFYFTRGPVVQGYAEARYPEPIAVDIHFCTRSDSGYVAMRPSVHCPDCDRS